MQHTSQHESVELEDTLAGEIAARQLYPAEPPSVREEWVDDRELPLDLAGAEPDPVLIRVTERFGLPQRLLVAPVEGGDDGAYRLLGDPRWLAAAREAGLRRLPVRVLDVTSTNADLLTLVLNQQQPANTAAQLDALLPLLDAELSEEEIARAAGLRKQQVSRLSKLRRLDPILQQALRDGAITPPTASTAAELPDLQPELSAEFEREGKLTSGQVRRINEEAIRRAARLAELEAAERQAAGGDAAGTAAQSEVDAEAAVEAEPVAAPLDAGEALLRELTGEQPIDRIQRQARELLEQLAGAELPPELRARLAAVLTEIERARPEAAR
ncbi:MAG: ParB/RepB/Spo0J family partition protein [Candidatus Dormiibacterota bacterium]